MMRRIQFLAAVLVMMSLSISGAFADEKVFRPDTAGTRVDSLVAVNLEGDELVKKFCNSCHTTDRIYSKMKALHGDQTADFEKDLKRIIVKKIRLTGGDISHKDGKKILEHLARL